VTHRHIVSAVFTVGWFPSPSDTIYNSPLFLFVDDHQHLPQSKFGDSSYHPNFLRASIYVLYIPSASRLASSTIYWIYYKVPQRLLIPIKPANPTIEKTKAYYCHPHVFIIRTQFCYLPHFSRRLESPHTCFKLSSRIYVFPREGEDGSEKMAVNRQDVKISRDERTAPLVEDHCVNYRYDSEFRTLLTI
jgi:hypothetical protein